ncbi:MAG: hypothetical protein KAH48_07650, partial [Chlorobi bacterium]|nr:hypothetical protein [Chlorobiota bacterium]
MVGKVLVGDINTRAKERDAHLFIIQIGGDELNGPSIATLNYLVQINNGSQSNLKLKIDSEEQLLNTYRDIYNEVANVAKPPKCYFDYITDCDGGGTLDVVMEVGGEIYTKSAEVDIPDAIKPYMKIEYKGKIVNELLIEDDNPANDDVVTDIKIKARNNDITITGYSSTNPNYSIEDLPSEILKKTDVIVKLVYKSGTANPTASDSIANKTVITILSDACSGNTMGAAWEMIPYLEDAPMDGTVVGTPKETTIFSSFCNKTHEDITITKIDRSGADAAVFDVISKFPQTVAAGTCIDIIYEFDPPSDGAYQADLTLTTSDNDTYTAIIYGNGSGKAGIAHEAFTVPNTNCASPNSTFDVIVNNTGPVDMKITKA